jgi:hypothetical protein
VKRIRFNRPVTIGATHLLHYCGPVHSEHQTGLSIADGDDLVFVPWTNVSEVRHENVNPARGMGSREDPPTVKAKKR